MCVDISIIRKYGMFGIMEGLFPRGNGMNLRQNVSVKMFYFEHNNQGEQQGLAGSALL